MGLAARDGTLSPLHFLPDFVTLIRSDRSGGSRVLLSQKTFLMSVDSTRQFHPNSSEDPSRFGALLLFLSLTWLFPSGIGFAADSVDVIFRYSPPGAPGTVSLPGEFNSWNNASWPMSNQGGGIWTRTARLRVGGNPSPPVNGVPGAWQYKFFYSGASPWPNDPLNHHVNPRDNENSFIYVKDPTIFHFLPNQRNPIVLTSFPVITAYIFPRVGSEVDTSTIALSIDGVVNNDLGGHYNFVSKQFAFTPVDPLPNGNHIVILTAGTTSDTVTFSTRGGFVQLLNQFPFTTWKDQWIVNGTVEDSLVTSAWIVRNFTDSLNVAVTNKSFSGAVSLVEGLNSIVARADSSGIPKSSSPVILTRRVNHSPTAKVSFQDNGSSIVLDGSPSIDPDSGQAVNLTYLWSADSSNPEVLSGLVNATTSQVSVNTPGIPGEYYFRLIVSDGDGNRDTLRSYFTLNDGLQLEFPSIASIPRWAQEARVYFLFPKAASVAGTLSASSARLQSIKALGFNVIWLMPVMKNAYPIDNGIGPGYNIVDFYNVAPEYGTNQDFKNFVSQAHSLGMKVILDVTPNHSSRFHPWSVDAHTYKSNSAYWEWYEHSLITGNTNGLGDCLDAEGFNYYCGFGDQLLNFNWDDIDFRNQMIDVYKYWIQEFGLDGYRFDVYWGPHRRYGEASMGKPVRDALKRIKPDILLLAEADGTGGGSELIYADRESGGIHGGVDAGYDFKLYFNQVRNFGFSSSAINNLNNEIDNGGFYPGEHALFMRFMESQDEDRIYYLDPNPSSYYNADAATAFMRTLPMASVLFTAPGFPMLWNGQEVGWGYGISGSKIARSRSIINWNYQGAGILSPHYQKIANIRGQFRAFTQHRKDTNLDGAVNNSDQPDFVRVSSSNSVVYAFARPYTDQNGLSVVNFSGVNQTTTLNLLSGPALTFVGGVQPTSVYWVNDLYANTHTTLPGSTLDSLTISLPPYGTAILTVSTTEDSVVITNPILATGDDYALPATFSISQNYPNPFNPLTTIQYEIPKSTFVSLKVFDVLGREMETLIDEVQAPGRKSVLWNAHRMPSGVYFYRLATPEFVSVTKMLLLR